jgi:hypothetical protein
MFFDVLDKMSIWVRCLFGVVLCICCCGPILIINPRAPMT